MEIYPRVSSLSGNGQHEVINSYEKWQLFLRCVALYLTASDFTCEFIHSLLSHPKCLHHPSQSAFILINLNTFVPPANVTWQLTLCFRSFMRKLNTGPSTDPRATPLVTSVCSENVYPYSLFPLLQLIIFQDFPSYTLAA